MEAQNEIAAIITSVVLTAMVLVGFWLFRRYQSKKKVE